MSNKSAACKFISAKTMVIPKPGKFPDVENKPIKSDTSGTDNIEDQKYQKGAAGPLEVDDEVDWEEHLKQLDSLSDEDKKEEDELRRDETRNVDPGDPRLENVRDHYSKGAAVLMQQAIKQAGVVGSLFRALSPSRADAPPPPPKISIKGLGYGALGGLGGGLLGAGGAAGATIGGLHGLFSDPGRDEEGERKSRLWRIVKGLLGGGALGVAGVGAGLAGGALGGALGATGGYRLGKQAGYWSELGGLLNPGNYLGPGHIGMLAAGLTPTRDLRAQAEADESIWKNLLIPGVGPYNSMKRLGGGIRGAEIKEMRRKLEEEREEERRATRDGDGDGRINDGTLEEKAAADLVKQAQKMRKQAQQPVDVNKLPGVAQVTEDASAQRDVQREMHPNRPQSGRTSNLQSWSPGITSTPAMDHAANLTFPPVDPASPGSVPNEGGIITDNLPTGYPGSTNTGQPQRTGRASGPVVDKANPWRRALGGPAGVISDYLEDKTRVWKGASVNNLMQEAIKQAAWYWPFSPSSGSRKGQLPERKIGDRVVSEREYGRHMDSQLAKNWSKDRPNDAAPGSAVGRVNKAIDTSKLTVNSFRGVPK